MIIPILEEELVFLDYLDYSYDGWGYRLVDDAPINAIESLSAYLLRLKRFEESLSIQSDTQD